MHGLIFRSFQNFLTDTYGADCWLGVVDAAALDFAEFEAMLGYDAALAHRVLAAAEKVLGKSRDTLLEDMGTYLVSHPNTQSVRRLLRFGGADFIDFLHSLDDLQDRVRLALSDLDMPALALTDDGPQQFTLNCRGFGGLFGHVFVGLLRAMADDYGALVCLEHKGRTGDCETIAITVFHASYAEGRSFDLAAGVADRRKGAP
ncbi:heme NO-binding domain-containing protein [Mesobacterium sp. TK19101]|uniref:Heme NO-binding domain-containing protein n=1 Tax=Mesobacterium hydrothermale TaxID=3111907 RepID=A0ABU6HIZ3_9RHOB|nr:heme NO-binding domain-containing protein [Mesobacterium sp. TK19101]MEC3861876.1 heme NO-binding domain-containing protein [Mesobacterium sp. TK19101]